MRTLALGGPEEQHDLSRLSEVSSTAVLRTDFRGQDRTRETRQEATAVIQTTDPATGPGQ